MLFSRIFRRQGSRASVCRPVLRSAEQLHYAGSLYVNAGDESGEWQCGGVPVQCHLIGIKK